MELEVVSLSEHGKEDLVQVYRAGVPTAAQRNEERMW